MVERQADELRAVGLQSSPDLVSAITMDLSLVSQQRSARRLLKEGLIQHGRLAGASVCRRLGHLQYHQNKWDCGGIEGVMFCVVKMYIVAYELMPYIEVAFHAPNNVHRLYIMTAQW
jgi:hypothetical protein